LLTLQQNSGKGYAVKTGMLAAKGALRLMVDADGATDFGSGLALLLDTTATSSIVFGSRAHLASKAQRSAVRTILMHAFHFFVEVLCSSKVRDTQCGFKLFSAEAAQALFQTQHLQRWAFDIELVILAERVGLSIEEVGVPWHEVDGSKLDTSKLQLAITSLGMLRDMICVRLCYELGIWKTKR
jgi:dolichyl-phosphate beta-glucosyltransferase